jgi:hypothetical protein
VTAWRSSDFVILLSLRYCLPTSTDRSLTKAEMGLFQSGTGNGQRTPILNYLLMLLIHPSLIEVPLIAIFTKMDALDKKVFSEQLNQGVPPLKAKANIASLAKAKFERDYLAPLSDSEKVAYPPKYTVQLRGKMFLRDLVT